MQLNKLTKKSKKFNHFFWLPFCLIFLFTGCVQRPVSGQDYTIINANDRALMGYEHDATTSTVTEVFWYGCPSCYEFQSLLEAWLDKKNGVKLQMMPSPASPTWSFHASLFYAIHSINAPQLHDAMYDFLHVQKRPIMSHEQFELFLRENDIEESDINDALAFLDSNELSQMIDQSYQFMLSIGANSVPALIVNGTYLVKENNDPKRMLEIVDYLLKHR